MTTENAAPSAGTDDDDAWFRQGKLPLSREDRIAEAIALIALLFSLGIGFVIALLPVSARAAEPAAASLELSRTVAASRDVITRAIDECREGEIR